MSRLIEVRSLVRPNIVDIDDKDLDDILLGDITIGPDNSLKVGTEATNDFGWNDLLSEVLVKGTGAQDPAWAVFRDGISGYAFSATAIREVQHRFHVLHDYAMGTVMYPHVHWSPNTTSTGTVRWGFEITVAKGHGQGASSVYGATSTVYVEETLASNRQYEHFTTEVDVADAIAADNLEPDSVILIRMFRDATHVNDTFPDAVFAWQTDLHFQMGTFMTKNKAPDFYA